MANERDRLAFIERRDGIPEAILFARQGILIYRRSVLQSRKRGHDKPHHASLPQYRREFIRSYLVFKRYLRSPV